jgi:integrase
MNGVDRVCKVEPETISGSAAGPAALTFAEAVEKWRAFKVRVWSPESRANMACWISRNVQALGSRPLAGIRPLDIQDLYEARDDGSLSGTMLNTDRRRLLCFWRWALRSELVDHDPTVAWPRKREVFTRPHDVLSQADEDALVREFEQARCAKGRRKARLVRFAVGSGLRIGEIRVLRWGWISQEGILTIPACSRKQGVELRTLLGRKALEALGPRGAPDELVFPGMPVRTVLNRELKKAARRAGLTVCISPHAFRRTWATRMLDAGAPAALVQKLQGWASMPVLVKHYHVMRDESALRYLNQI